MSDLSRSKPSVSVVVPVKDEELTVGWLVPEIVHVLEAAGVQPEVIVVDDGSTDGTAGAVEDLAAADGRVRLLRLSRNFGHQAALVAGMTAATGDAIVTMDGDGQHPPAVLRQLVREWERGADVVHTVREDSHDVSAFKRATSRGFYRLFRALSGLALREGMADFRLLDRRACRAVLDVVGAKPFVRGAAVWVGFHEASVSYRAADRTAGRSSYTLASMLRLARDGVVGFSARPLYLLSGFGLAASVLAFVIAGYAIVVGLLAEQAAPGWASSIVFMAVLNALLFVVLGMLSVYIAAIYDQVSGRPPYIVAARDEDVRAKTDPDGPAGTDE
jgi:polyisoprenyl-phosphate glycosyltransferase